MSRQFGKYIIISCIGIFLSFNCFGQNLEYFIGQGLQNSPLLKDFQNQIKTSELDSLMAAAAQRPQVNSNTQILKAPFGNNFGYDDAITNGGLYSSTVGVSQYILNKKTLQNKYESLSIDRTLIRNNTKISTNDLKRLITTQYLSAFSDYTEMLFNKKVNQLIDNELQLMKQLVQQGLYKQTDYLSLLIENQKQDITSQQLLMLYQKDFHTLNQICGIADSIPEKLDLPEIAVVSFSDLASSPLLIQFQIDSLKIENNRKAVDFRYIPKLNWFADAGLISSDPTAIYKHLGASVGLTLTVPLYDGHQKKLDYQKLDLSENTRQQYLNFNKNQLSTQVRLLTYELESTKKIEEKLSQQMKSIEELVNLSKLQLNAGQISVIELVSNLKNYIDIYRSYNQTTVQKLLLINELNYYQQQ